MVPSSLARLAILVSSVYAVSCGACASVSVPLCLCLCSLCAVLSGRECSNPLLPLAEGVRRALNN